MSEISLKEQIEYQQKMLTNMKEYNFTHPTHEAILASLKELEQIKEIEHIKKTTCKHLGLKWVCHNLVCIYCDKVLTKEEANSLEWLKPNEVG